MRVANKSIKRTKLIDVIIDAITGSKIYDTIEYIHKDENYIKSFIYPHLIEELKEFYVSSESLLESSAQKKAELSVLWEGNKKTTVNNILFLGTYHRPDMVVEYKDVSVAIKFKKGSTGSSVREGLGQSLIYSNNYDFTIYLYIDVSKDKRIKKAVELTAENSFRNELWKRYNIRFDVI